MDDSHVSEMGRSGPTNDQSAYILFYLKEKEEVLEKAIAAAVTGKLLVEGKKRKAEPESESESASEDEEADSFDDEAAYRAALKRQKANSAPRLQSRSLSPAQCDDEDESDTPATPPSSTAQAPNSTRCYPPSPNPPRASMHPPTPRLSNPSPYPAPPTRNWEPPSTATSTNRSSGPTLHSTLRGLIRKLNRLTRSLLRPCRRRRSASRRRLHRPYMRLSSRGVFLPRRTQVR